MILIKTYKESGLISEKVKEDGIINLNINHIEYIKEHDNSKFLFVMLFSSSSFIISKEDAIKNNLWEAQENE